MVFLSAEVKILIQCEYQLYSVTVSLRLASKARCHADDEVRVGGVSTIGCSRKKTCARQILNSPP